MVPLADEQALSAAQASRPKLWFSIHSGLVSIDDCAPALAASVAKTKDAAQRPVFWKALMACNPK